MSLIGYNTKQQMVLSSLVGDADIDELISEIFNTRVDIEYLHARNSEACCFSCKVERIKL